MHLGRALTSIIAVLLTAAPAAPKTGNSTHPAISVGPIRRSPATGAPAKEFTVEVLAPGESKPHRFVVTGPDKLIDEGETPRAVVVGDRLLVHTLSVVAVFDLSTGRRVFDAVASPEVAATADGRRVAFKEPQLPFTAKEATTTVVQVLDVSTLDLQPVFPDRSAIETNQSGLLMVWEEDPLKRHVVDRLFWSPDGSRLLFFCAHGEIGAAGGPLEHYLTVVDLSSGLRDSRFIHRPFDWTPYMRRGVDLKGRKPFFAVDSVTWSEDGKLIVRPSPAAWWLEDPIVVPLPADAAGAAGREGA